MRTQTLKERHDRPRCVLSAAAACSRRRQPLQAAARVVGEGANIPAPPTLPSTPIKNGGDYTVYGAMHQLQSLIHNKDVTGPPAISIVGYIVDSNIPRAPDCAVHKTGKTDPDNCNPEVPSFWVADEKGNTKGQKIRVVGWARNFAVIFDAMKAYKKLKAGEQPTRAGHRRHAERHGAVPVARSGRQGEDTGAYNVARTVVSDMVSEPAGGVMALQKMEKLEPPTEPVKFAKKMP